MEMVEMEMVVMLNGNDNNNMAELITGTDIIATDGSWTIRHKTQQQQQMYLPTNETKKFVYK